MANSTSHEVSVLASGVDGVTVVVTTTAEATVGEAEVTNNRP
jgi:hypothetical protein